MEQLQPSYFKAPAHRHMRAVGTQCVFGLPMRAACILSQTALLLMLNGGSGVSCYIVVCWDNAMRAPSFHGARPSSGEVWDYT